MRQIAGLPSTHRQEEQLEGEDVPLLAITGCHFPELAACLKRLLDAAMDITVDLMPERGLQKQLPARQRAHWVHKAEHACSVLEAQNL